MTKNLYTLPKATFTGTLYTIGYEGLTIDKYINKLKQHGIRAVADIRKNAWSRKPGFSQDSLIVRFGRENIEYYSIPALGIVSAKRKNLKTQKDYDELFAEYCATTLVENNDALYNIYFLLSNFQRVAITCFEKHHTNCHRSCVANEIVKQLSSVNKNFTYSSINHI